MTFATETHLGLNPTQSHASILIIDVPPKIWRPKVKSSYEPLDYATDIDDDYFIYKQFGKTLKSDINTNIPQRTDLQIWDDKFLPELQSNLRVGVDATPEIQDRIVSIIKTNWDSFFEAGTRRPILGFEFCIDTGGAAPICCRQPCYGPHESKIIQQQVDALLADGLIRECKGPWGSSIVLAPKPHQEDVMDISKFKWRMCVSYRALNSKTLPFEYPIPRCIDAIENLGDASGRLYFISLDARQGFHQILVHLEDQDKLAFFAPDGKKYTFVVMPFGPRNGPATYTAMMRKLKDEWDALFYQRNPGTLPAHGSNTIIDDILCWASCPTLLLSYFECVCAIFVKYRVSFRLDKCEFFMDRVEYVGHDLTPNGNCPASSKFNLVADWPLPSNGLNLHSFLGLCSFYSRFQPWFELDVTPFRALIRKYKRRPIPPEEWTESNKDLFHQLKKAIVSSPCLARYDASKPCFLKTDWSATGMGYVLMQPDTSSLADTIINHWDDIAAGQLETSLNGARLRPIVFGSRRCTTKECHFHSFAGEAACGRWAIGQLRKYLWGTHFYWMTDCIALKEFLEYDGPIHQVKRWAQELLGYYFTILHRPERMMRDVDALSRMYDPLIMQYAATADANSLADRAARPQAYTIMPIDALTRSLAPPEGLAPATTPARMLATNVRTFTNLPPRFFPIQRILTNVTPTRADMTKPSLESGTHITAAAIITTWVSINSGIPGIALKLAQGPHPFNLHIVDAEAWVADTIPALKAMMPSSNVTVQCDTLHTLSTNPSLLPDIVHGVDATCTHPDTTSQLLWLEHVSRLLKDVFLPRGLEAFCLVTRAQSPQDNCTELSQYVANAFNSTTWNLVCGNLAPAALGDATSDPRWLCLALHRKPYEASYFPALIPPLSIARTLVVYRTVPTPITTTTETPSAASR